MWVNMYQYKLILMYEMSHKIIYSNGKKKKKICELLKLLGHFLNVRMYKIAVEFKNCTYENVVTNMHIAFYFYVMVHIFVFLNLRIWKNIYIYIFLCCIPHKGFHMILKKSAFDQVTQNRAFSDSGNRMLAYLKKWLCNDENVCRISNIQKENIQ